MLAVACGGDDTKMPWDDALGGGNQGEQPAPGDGENGDGTEGDDTEGDIDDGTPKVGKTLPAWSEGCLDIHFINTGRGECAFYILPDGTTLLVDAGEIVTEENSVPQRPRDGVRPYIVYAEYIKHFHPEGKSQEKPIIDYCAPSHFHIDHIGGSAAVTETDSEGGYRKAGLMALYDKVLYKHVIDRSYPDYKENATTPAMEGQLCEDWAKFVKWGVENGKFTGARFTPGEEQIVMLNNKAGYSNFELLNICANGFVVGKDSSGATTILGEKSGVGNPASCGFHIRYGNFDYIACGDLTSAPQNLVAGYFHDFIGDGKLDAFKCHHHLSANAWGSQMQKKTFNPHIIVNMNFYKSQPNAELLGKIFNNEFSFWSREFFTSNGHPEAVSENSALYDKMAGYNGHIVIRVAAGGGEFNVYMLDDTNYDYKVKSIHGPYNSK